MWAFIRLAIRNVFRAKARSAITIGALFFGVLMSMVFGGFLLGMAESLVTDTIETRMGAFQVHKAGYFETRDRQPLKLNMDQSGDVAEVLKQIPGVAGVTPRIAFSGMVSNGSSGTVFLGQAIDPKSLQLGLPGALKIVEGKPLSADAPNSASVGGQLADALGAKTGATLMLQSQTLKGRDNAMDVEVLSTVHGTTPLDSKRTVTVTLDFAQSLLGMKGKVTEYVVAVKDRREIENIAQQVREKLGPEYEVHTWVQLRPAIADVIKTQRVILGLVSFVFLLIAVFGVANTLLMSVMERTREIGTMLAFGMKRFQVGMLFVLEAAAQAFLGAFSGFVVAQVVLKVLRDRGGVPISMGEGQPPFMVLPDLPVGFVAIAMSAAVIGAILAALYPASRAAKLRPVEALASN